MVRDIHKSTLRIGTRVNTEKLLFATSAPHICHKALLDDRLDTFDTHKLLPFVLWTLFDGLFSFVHPGGRLRRLHRGDGILIGTIALIESRNKWTCHVRWRICGSHKGGNHDRRGRWNRRLPARRGTETTRDSGPQGMRKIAQKITHRVVNWDHKYIVRKQAKERRQNPKSQQPYQGKVDENRAYEVTRE